MKFLKTVLKVWGWLCLASLVLYLYWNVYNGNSPLDGFSPDTTGLELCVCIGFWVGMGLISLGLARVIELLETK